MKNTKSLKEIGVKWAFEIPSEGSSSPIQLRSYHLYHKQLSQYELDDIRFMIGQEIGSQYLVEIAINHLKNDLLLEASYYEGDLLNIIFKLPSLFWEKHSELTLSFLHLLQENQDKINNKLDLSIDVEAFNQFINTHCDKKK